MRMVTTKMPADELPWVDVVDLLANANLRNLSKSGSEWTFSCFSGNHSHGDATPSAGMNGRTTLWQCRSPSCGLRGNAADFVAALRGISRTEALRWLEERYGGPGLSVAPGELEEHVARIRSLAQHEDEQRVRPTEDEQRRYVKNRELSNAARQYLSGRGFDDATLTEWGVGLDLLSHRITIPVRGPNGELVGFKARAIDPDLHPRYLVLGHQLGEQLWRYPYNTYRKGDFVFGLHRFRPGDGYVVIVEGELNAIALDQMEIGAVAVAGAEFSERQREQIVSFFDEVVIFFDPDDAGAAGTRKVAEALTSDMAVKIVVDQLGDAARALESDSQFGREEVTRWIADAVPYSLYKRNQR